MDTGNTSTVLPLISNSPFASFPDGSVTLSIVTVVLLTLVASIVRFVQYRREFYILNGSLKGPPFSMLTGTVGSFVAGFMVSPPDAHPHSVLTNIYRQQNLGGLYWLDNWPVAASGVARQLIVVDPAVAAQATNLPKNRVYRDLLWSICGETSMLWANGEEWRHYRSLFNPGFALGHLMSLVPLIVDETLIFKQNLLKYAESGEILQVEIAARNLAIDIMGRVILDHSLNSQTSDNELVTTFLKAVQVVPDIQSLIAPAHFNIVSMIKRRMYRRTMHKYVGKILDDRYTWYVNNADAAYKKKKGGKPIIDLTLDEYFAEERKKLRSGSTIGLEPEFRTSSIGNIMIFLLAGHDTTSSTLAYVYYLLSEHPEKLKKLRQEFDQVFGPNLSLTAEQIKAEPYIIRKLDYTTGVIKETLRLFPPATAIRGGNNSKLTYNGVEYNTGTDMVWLQNHTLHRRSDLFPSPDEFIPERWLPAPNNFQEIPKDAYRPFEKGPRACIGQELAMLEIKIFMALTLRDLDVTGAYEEWDLRLGRKKPGDTLGGKRGMFGYRGYQILEATAKPVDGMPVKVKKRAT